MANEKSTEQIKKEFLDHINGLVGYWEREGENTKDALEGLAFSIMSTLDGSSSFPSFIVAPYPHPDDKQYLIDNGEDYYPENHESKVKGDIAGSLHELIGKTK